MVGCRCWVGNLSWNPSDIYMYQLSFDTWKFNCTIGGQVGSQAGNDMDIFPTFEFQIWDDHCWWFLYQFRLSTFDIGIRNVGDQKSRWVLQKLYWQCRLSTSEVKIKKFRIKKLEWIIFRVVWERWIPMSIQLESEQPSSEK